MMMPVFAYKALETETKRVVEGNIEAIDLRHAKQLLRNQGKMVQKLDKIQQRRGNAASFGFTSINGVGGVGRLKVLLGQQPSLKHVYMFTQQMGTLLGSGIPLVETLYLIEQQTVHVGFRQLLQQIRADVINGYTFSGALIRCKGTFSRLFIAMVKAGEQTGDLSRVFLRLEQLIKTQIGLRNKITGALIMPTMTLLVISAVLVIMLIFVVPQFEQMFDSRGADLPFITITLLTASKTLQNFWWLILIGLFVLGAWFNVFRQGIGKPLVDSTLLGSSASRPLEESNVFPMLVTKMLAIGEQTGEMEVMLNKAAQFLESEIDIGITLLTEMVQPLITIVLGVLLLYVVLAIYLPIFALNKVVAG